MTVFLFSSRPGISGMPRFFAGNFYEFLAPPNGKRHIGNSGCGVVLRFRSATRQSIRKERYWLRNRKLVHGANMYVMPQLGGRISWRERCKPGPRHQDLLFVRHVYRYRGLCGLAVAFRKRLKSSKLLKTVPGLIFKSRQC